MDAGPLLLWLLIVPYMDQGCRQRMPIVSRVPEAR